MSKSSQQLPVAIIGIGCIFAKSEDQKSFLHLLNKGVSAISDPPASHQYLADYFDPDPKKPDHIYCNRGGYLPSVDFDPTEFSIPPNVLEATDTSQLLGLVTAKNALRDAGYDEKGKSFDRTKASVILGVTGTQELVIPLGSRLGHPRWQKALQASGVPDHQAEEVIARISDSYVDWQENSFPGLLGNVVAGRIANRLDFGGTNCVVDAACASSMGAVHMALLELTSGRSDMVITGGVDTINDAFMHMCFSKTQILSASGDIRPFSKDADGTVLGEGVGMVVLKRLEDAERDGDRVYAVIKGIGSASDGKSQSIYAPRPEGQARALNRAYQGAGVDPTTVALVEAHGTGTRVGDQVEFKALCDVFGATIPNGNRCALGSVKSNIGHTKAAAGTAGLIKMALSIYHKVLPPTLKAEDPDPKLGIEHSPFYLNTKLRPWLSGNGDKRRAGVSAFGFGGSNFHTVLEEYATEKLEPAWDGTVEIAAFSGKSPQAIIDQITRWIEQVQTKPSRHQIGKHARQSRLQFKAGDAHRMLITLDLNQPFEATQTLCQRAIQHMSESATSSDTHIFYGSGLKPGKMAFLFPGQGSQYVGMGRDLTCCFPQSLSAFQRAGVNFDDAQRLDDYIYPRMDIANPDHELQLRRTQVAQPAIGAVSVAMLKALTFFDVTPHATCGHSYGELTALHAAGWMTEEDLWQLSVTRGRLMAEAGSATSDTGTMLAVNAPLEEIDALVSTLEEPVVLANRNSHQQGVLSGSRASIDAAQTACKAKGWRTVPLPVAAAFHSPLVADAQKPFSQKVATVNLKPGQTTVMSNTQGTPYPADATTVAGLLGGQLANPVNFVGNIEALYQQGVRTFVEVGPKNVLTRLVQQTLDGKEIQSVAMDHSCGRQSGVLDLAKTLCLIAAQGHTVQLDRWEKTATAGRKARMAVSISGANYRDPNSSPKRYKQTATKPEPALTTAPESGGNAEQTVQTIQKKIPTQPVKSVAPPVMAPKTATTQSLKSALSTVQQGLASLQALQAQTTQAHQKYLDTQAEASKTIQQLIHSTQQLTGSSPAFPLPAATPARMPTETTVPVPPAAASLEKHPTADQQPVVAAVIKPEPDSLADQNQLQQTLIDIVSQLTGYPGDMLGVEMDIEADLGIDSIKRVEILSALEERLPNLPKVTPDMMGTLKTLGQICDYLSSGSSAPASSAETKPAPSNVDTDMIQQTLIDIVSQLTGYPGDMLGTEMDIEADLGIDSIKRVEILSALEEKLPNLPKVTPDMMGTLKTLGQICDYLCAPEPKSETPQCKAPCPNPQQAAPLATPSIQRQTVSVVPVDTLEWKKPTWLSNHIVGLVGGSESMGAALVTAFEAQGVTARILSHTETLLSMDGQLGGLMLLAPLDARDAFQWAKAAGPLLQQAGRQGTAGLITVSFLDGAFGFNGGVIDTPEQGALAGLAKTAGIEWPDVFCRALDVDPAWQDFQAVSKAVVAEVTHLATQPLTEIGLGHKQRITLQLTPAEVQSPTGKITLTKDDVVVVTGGARGVTAAAAFALCDHAPCTLALMGRSPEPQPEPAWLVDRQSAAEMKQAIITHLFESKTPTPAQVEAVFRKYSTNREMQTNLDQLAQKGITARYFSADVCNPAAVEASLGIIRKELGPIKGLIHGAGVLEDRFIADKERSQFDKVYDTKVVGLQTLLNATHMDDLCYLVLFSSVSARMGNQGQVDYAMANEVLNKVGYQQARLMPDCKVVAINWGPWDGGMVTPGLRRAFTERGVGLIPIDAGAQAMVAEMKQPRSSAIEVVVGAPLHHAHQAPAPPRDDKTATADMTVTCKREINLNNYPVLNSHQIDGRPVVPLALITEWLAHSALHANPGLILHGIDRLRLFNGITMDETERQINMLAGKAQRSGQLFEVDVEVRNGVPKEQAMVHSSARAILAENLPSPPKFKENGHFKSTPSQYSLDEVYEQILFHGRDLHAIQEIIALTEHAMSAHIASAPAPSQWINQPLRSNWIADPLILDGAFQMAIVWCYDQLGQVCLPSYAERYRQYSRCFPSEGVSAIMEVRKTTDHKMVCDFTFLDQHKSVVAELNGYEAVITPNLLKAFKAA